MTSLQTTKGNQHNDYIEPEIIEPGTWKQQRSSHQREMYPRSFLMKLKFFFILAVLLVSFGLIAVGLVLTATVIGALFGVPLIAAGAVILWLLGKTMLTSSANNTFIFRRF